MNINELTIGQAKELASMFSDKKENNFLKNYIGKYVIVRSRNEGINSGIVKDIDETGVVLTEARRIWYHKPKDKSTAWYEGVSISGLSEDSKISTKCIEKIIIEDYSLTICSKEAQESISNYKTTERKC